MEIQAASLAQVLKSRDGRLVHVEADVGSVVQSLREIDPGLRVRYSEAGEYFVVYFEDKENPEPGNGHLVLTAQELDGRIVDRVRRIMHSSYDYAAELEKTDAKAEAQREHAFSEQMGEAHERLAHAIRRDLGLKGKIFVPER